MYSVLTVKWYELMDAHKTNINLVIILTNLMT